MSVKRCSRADCEHIMCSRYSPRYGYLCDSCFEELLRHGFHTNIDYFMATNPNPDPEAFLDATCVYFNSIFHLGE